MKVGDLVKSKYAPTPMGIVIEVCDGLGIPTITIMVQDGSFMFDQREEFFELFHEGR